MYCTTCGIELRPENQYCSKCGTKVESSNETSPEPIETTEGSIDTLKAGTNSLPENTDRGTNGNKFVSFLTNNKKKMIIILSALIVLIISITVIRYRIEHSPKTFLDRVQVIMDKFESGVQRENNDLSTTDFSTLRTDGQIDLSDAGSKYEFLGYEFAEASMQLTLLSWHDKVPKTQELLDFYNELSKVLVDYSNANKQLRDAIKDKTDTTSIINDMASILDRYAEVTQKHTNLVNKYS